VLMVATGGVVLVMRRCGRVSYPRERLVYLEVKKIERTLVLGFIAIAASAVLLVSYATHSSAESHFGSCAAQHEKFAQTLDEVRFATSAVRAVSTALAYSERSRRAYYEEITTMRKQLTRANNPAAQRALVQASVILSNQEAPIGQAQAITSESKRELRSGVALISETSSVLSDGDCRELSLTLASSGWPKDHLLAHLAMAAQLNTKVSDQLDAALALITQAQKLVR
jgi:hypothetical protein